MSHFAVLVIGENIEEQLAPYQENNMGDCPQEYLEFNVEVPKEEVKDYVKKSLETMKGSDKAKCSKMKDEQFMKKYAGFIPDDDGDYGFLINPDSRWDWWVIGGRWRGYFKLKPGRTGVVGDRSATDKEDRRIWPDGVDQARKGDIDFDSMRRLKLKEVRENWKKFLALQDKETREKEAYRLEIEPDDTKEKYLRRKTSIATFGVVKDGQWYEKGQMGWWGFVRDKKEDEAWQEEFDKLLDGLPDDALLTVIDCHV